MIIINIVHRPPIVLSRWPLIVARPVSHHRRPEERDSDTLRAENQTVLSAVQIGNFLRGGRLKPRMHMFSIKFMYSIQFF